MSNASKANNANNASNANDARKRIEEINMEIKLNIIKISEYHRQIRELKHVSSSTKEEEREMIYKQISELEYTNMYLKFERMELKKSAC